MTVPTLIRVCAVVLCALFLTACAADDDPEQAELEPAPTDDPDETDETEDTQDDDPGEEPAEDARTGSNQPGCVDDPEEGTDYFPDQVTFEHAEAVEATYHDSYKVLDVAFPFDDAGARYVLVQCGLDAPQLEGDLADATVIEVPVAEAVTMTTTNLPHFDTLEAVDTLVGVGDPDFVTTPSVLEAIEAGDVEGYGDAEGAPDTERVIAAEPDVLALDAFGETVLDTAAQLGDAGVPVLLNSDFEETTLLGRAEWLKVTAMLLNAEAGAEARFAEIEEAYHEVAEQVADVDDQPVVLSEMPFEGTWFVPGGQSVTARAIEEAGGQYVFADDEATESIALDLETVIDQASDADIWIAAGSVHGTLDDLLATDERFGEFAAFQNGRVWAGDAAVTPEGGNARFEEAYLRADLFLADLAAIFHPDLVDHEPIYYGQVPQE